MVKRATEYFRGCLLGGAIGDALGWPVEFKTHQEIVQAYGEYGISDLIVGTSGKAEITDDTQMTLFTAEGLLRAQTRGEARGICHPPSIVYNAYLRWLHTQGDPKLPGREFIYDGWLIGVNQLHARRAPGNSCLSALRSGKQGTIQEPINDSKGCGGVMRVAPVGLVHGRDKAFEVAAECAALTHGHPSGYLSAGVLAHIIALLIEGTELATAIEGAMEVLTALPNHEECLQALELAVELAKSDQPPLAAISELGEGWVGEEALAISVYCALKYQSDFRQALIVSINHDGDSDSTGAITGNILGAYLGISHIPQEWVEKVELADVITQIADDLLTRYSEDAAWWNRYPGY